MPSLTCSYTETLYVIVSCFELTTFILYQGGQILFFYLCVCGGGGGEFCTAEFLLIEFQRIWMALFQNIDLCFGQRGGSPAPLSYLIRLCLSQHYSIITKNSRECWEILKATTKHAGSANSESILFFIQ